MCGLFGGIGKLNSGRMIALGSMNEERGTDSVGLAYIREGVLSVAKVAERPCMALNVTLRKQVTEAAVSGMFIGHTRQATQGSVTSKNAHPFQVENIAFAHNGIILNDEEFGKYDVDSESLIHGIKARDFSKYDGCIALLWIEEGKLKAFRCGNPLYRGRHNGTLYLASDDEYLKAAGCTAVKALSEGMIYTFHTPTHITTERVSKNKTFTYSKSYSGEYQGMLGTSYADYISKETHVLTPSERQAQWWKEEKIKDEIEARLEEAKEDFRTEKDVEKERVKSFQDTCNCCGDYTELNDGMCLACLQYMRDNAIDDRDVPPFMQVLR